MKKIYAVLLLSGVICFSLAVPTFADSDAIDEASTIVNEESSDEIVIMDEQPIDEGQIIEVAEDEVTDEAVDSENVGLADDKDNVIVTQESSVKDGRTMYYSSISNGTSKIKLDEETTWGLIDVPSDGNYLGYLVLGLYGDVSISIVEADTDACVYQAYNEEEEGCWLIGHRFIVLEKGKSYNVKVSTEGKSHFSLKVNYERFKGNTLLNDKLFNRAYNGEPLTEYTLFKNIHFSNASISNVTFSTKSDYSNPTTTYPTDAGTYYVKYTILSDDGLVTYTKPDVAKIYKARPTIAVANTEKVLSYTDLKKTYKSFSIGASTTGDGKLTYEKIGGSSSLKVKSNGRVYAVKGTAKGRHTITVKVKAAATGNYKAVEITQKITVDVI